MDKDSVHTSNLYKSRKTLLKQLETRGYDVEPYMNFDIHEIYLMNESKQLDFSVKHKTEKSNVYVKYSLQRNPTERSITEYIESIGETFNKNTDQVIYILKQEPNQTVTELCKLLYSQDGYFITMFNINRLLYNILNHSLVPPHRILTDEETTNMMKRYNIKTLKQLPEISRFDPVAMVVGLRPNQVCEITRKSETAIYTKYYRICI